MQLIAALLGTLGIFLPLALCEKKYIKKHLNVTKPKQPTDKRWMGNFAQAFIKSQPVQRFSMHYNTDLFGQSEDAPNNHYEFNDGAIPFEDHQDREEQSFQGLKEIKVPKGAGAASERSPNENAVMFASDIAQYLKPGIGDDPSDMPGGLKNYGGSLNGVGLPIAGKLRSTKLNPVASFAEQAGDELDSHKMLLSPGTAVIPAAIADSIRSDSSTTKLLDEMPGKISEVSASVAESSKAFTGNGESSMIVSSNPDPSPTSALTVATDNSVTAQVDTSETATNDQPSSSSSSSSTDTAASDKSKQEADTSTTETKDAKEPEKTNEPGITNDSDQTPIKPKKLKQSTGHSAKSNDTTKKLTENKRPNSDEGGDKTSAKAVEVSAGKDVSIGDESPGNTTNEDDGVEEEAEKTPNKVKEKLVSSLREALLENVKEMLNGENSKQLLEEAQAVSDDKPVNLTNNQDEDEGSAENVSPSKETPDSHYIDDVKDDKGMDDLGPKDVGKQPANLLETNLMKIDKKKLVHLLATLMKRYKSNGTPAEDADSDETKNKEPEKSDGQKSKEISKSSDSKHDDEKIDEETLQALKNATKGKKLVEEKEQKENKDESKSTENKLMKLNNLRHAQKAVSRDFFDPYAQIGLTDPKVSGVSNNPAVSNKKVEETPIGRHSVHINLFGDELKTNDILRASKEFEGKVEAETQRAEEIVNEKVDKQKAKLEAEVQKAHAKESLENEDLLKASKEMMRLGMKSHSEDNGKENEKGIGVLSRLEDLKIANMKPTGIDQSGLVKGTSSQLDDKATTETSKSLDGKESTKLAQFELLKSAEKEKADAMKEAESVQAELAKEKEELRLLREQAKQEKAKEEELKLANAELEAKDEKERAAFLEKVRIQQEKDSKQDDKEQRLKQSKSDKEEESSGIVKISDKLKGEDVNLAEKFAGKAEFAAEKGERQLEKAESESSAQLNVGRVIGEEKEKLLAKEKGSKEEKLDESRNQNAGKVKDYEELKTAKMKQMEAEKANEDDVKQNPDKMKANSAPAKSKEDQKELKISIAAEDEKNKNVDITVGKPNENELKEVESIIEEKEKKVKSMNKETEEELNRKEKELKEVEKEVEMKGKKENKEKNNDGLNNNNKQEKEEENKLIEKYDPNEKKPLDEDSNRYIHYISPDMVNAIAAKVPSSVTEPDSEAAKYVEGTFVNNKGFSDGTDKEASNLKDHREDRPMRMKAAVGEALLKEKTGDKLVADEKQKEENQPERIEDEVGKDSREKSKEKSEKLKEQEIKQKNDEFMAIDGPNIETLIQHMEERMRQKKKEKEGEREQSKLSSSPKEIRKKSRYQQDDAYAQIGSLDPNVKRRKIGKKARKHIHHHHLRIRS